MLLFWHKYRFLIGLTSVVIGALATNNNSWIHLVFFQKWNFKETTGETTHGSWSRTSVEGRMGLASLSAEDSLSKSFTQESSGSCKSLITKTQMLGLEINFVALFVTFWNGIKPVPWRLHSVKTSPFSCLLVCSSLINIHTVWKWNISSMLQ